MPVFRVERNTGYTVMSNHHLRNKELTLKSKGLVVANAFVARLGLYPCRAIPYQPGKNRRNREAVKELEKSRVSSAAGSATKKAACGVRTISSMSSRCYPKNQHPTTSRLYRIILHWKIQHWIILRWKNLRWKIQRN